MNDVFKFLASHKHTVPVIVEEIVKKHKQVNIFLAVHAKIQRHLLIFKNIVKAKIGIKTVASV